MSYNWVPSSFKTKTKPKPASPTDLRDSSSGLPGMISDQKPVDQP